MRLIKFTVAVWFDPQWARFFRASALKRRYWWARQPGQFTLGPLRLDVKVEEGLVADG
jgi:hypothetical protein